jgi:hypothetical protein
MLANINKTAAIYASFYHIKVLQKKSLKIPKRESESVNLRTNNTMVKRKRKKVQKIYQISHR